MSRHEEEGGSSEYAAPKHTIVERKVGADGVMTTTVIIDGTVAEFEVPVAMHDQAASLADPEERAAHEILDQLYSEDAPEGE